MSIACSFVSFDVQSHEYFGKSDGSAQVQVLVMRITTALLHIQVLLGKGGVTPPPPFSEFLRCILGLTMWRFIPALMLF